MYIMDITADKKMFIKADEFVISGNFVYFYKNKKRFAVYNLNNILGFAECNVTSEDYKWLRTKDTVIE